MGKFFIQLWCNMNWKPFIYQKLFDFRKIYQIVTDMWRKMLFLSIFQKSLKIPWSWRYRKLLTICHCSPGVSGTNVSDDSVFCMTTAVSIDSYFLFFCWLSILARKHFTIHTSTFPWLEIQNIKKYRNTYLHGSCGEFTRVKWLYQFFSR